MSSEQQRRLKITDLLREVAAKTESLIRDLEAYDPREASEVDNLYLNARPARILKEEGIRTIGQIQALSDAQMLRWPGFGRKSLAEVRAEVARFLAEKPSISGVPRPAVDEACFHLAWSSLHGDDSPGATDDDVWALAKAIQDACEDARRTVDDRAKADDPTMDATP